DFFFFNDTATTEIYTLSLHDALPISRRIRCAIPYSARTAMKSRYGAATGSGGVGKAVSQTRSPTPLTTATAPATAGGSGVSGCTRCSRWTAPHEHSR